MFAGCILHNYLMGIDPNKRLIDEVDAELNSMPIEIQEKRALTQSHEYGDGEIFRERIAMSMWNEYF